MSALDWDSARRADRQRKALREAQENAPRRRGLSMTDKQAAYLQKLCDHHGRSFDQTLDRASASTLIGALRNAPATHRYEQ